MSDATIVIPQHDGAELTLAVVGAVQRHESVPWPVIVVDDGSNSDAADVVVRRQADVTVLRQPHLGVTAAWSRGLAAVTTPLVVLLNNDVHVAGPWVDCLSQPIRDRRARVCGVELRRERAVPRPVLRSLGRSDFAAGWCWAFRAEDVHSIGGFDASLRFYFSDTDLQARLLRSTTPGSGLVIVSDLPLRHVGHRSMRRLPDRRALWEQDRQQFIEKWAGDWR